MKIRFTKKEGEKWKKNEVRQVERWQIAQGFVIYDKDLDLYMEGGEVYYEARTEVGKI